MMPDLSICIVNHNTLELTAQCVQSISETAGDLNIEVFIVNNTWDDSDRIATLARAFNFLQVIQNERPLGFATNQNQMLRRAVGRYLMPLNSDTIILPGALRELANFMDEHTSTGIAGPRLVHPDGELQPSCRNFPTPVTHFLEASGLWHFLRGHDSIGRHYYICSSHTEVRQVDWLTGACLIVRAAAARQVGYYNDQLFPHAYGEDIEWCWRMRQAGWQVMFDAHATVVHLESQSPLPDRTLQMYRGFYSFCAQCYPKSKQHAIRTATVLALLPRWLLARDRKAHATYKALMRLSMPTKRQTA